MYYIIHAGTLHEIGKFTDEDLALENGLCRSSVLTIRQPSRILRRCF